MVRRTPLSQCEAWCERGSGTQYGHRTSSGDTCAVTLRTELRNLCVVVDKVEGEVVARLTHGLVTSFVSCDYDAFMLS